MSAASLILCTCSTQAEATAIARTLVEERLAACVNLVPQVESIYRWQGEIETSQEVLLLIKSSTAMFPLLRDRIQQLHSYDTPEVLAVAIGDGSPKYLTWLLDQVSVRSSE